MSGPGEETAIPCRTFLTSLHLVTDPLCASVFEDTNQVHARCNCKQWGKIELVEAHIADYTVLDCQPSCSTNGFDPLTTIWRQEHIIRFTMQLFGDAEAALFNVNLLERDRSDDDRRTSVCNEIRCWAAVDWISPLRGLFSPDSDIPMSCRRRQYFQDRFQGRCRWVRLLTNVRPEGPLI